MAKEPQPVEDGPLTDPEAPIETAIPFSVEQETMANVSDGGKTHNRLLCLTPFLLLVWPTVRRSAEDEHVIITCEGQNPSEIDLSVDNVNW